MYGQGRVKATAIVTAQQHVHFGPAPPSHKPVSEQASVILKKHYIAESGPPLRIAHQRGRASYDRGHARPAELHFGHSKASSL